MNKMTKEHIYMCREAAEQIRTYAAMEIKTFTDLGWSDSTIKIVGKAWEEKACKWDTLAEELEELLEVPKKFSILREDLEKRKTLLKRLEEAGNTGLDLSPGDALCAEAAAEIRRLHKVIKRLQGD
jgi:hypothetical protein